jgi:TonB family protein
MGNSATPPVLFSLLPEQRTPWTEFVFSSGIQACAAALLVWLRLLHPGVVPAPEHTFRSVQLVSTPVPVNRQPQAVHLPAKPVYQADLIPPANDPPANDPPANALRLPAALAKTTPLAEAPAPAVSISPKKFDAVSVSAAPVISTPVIPKLVATNVFSSGSSAAPTVARDPEHVQTGGFGDPNGVPAKLNQGKAVNVAGLGSYDLPAGGGYGNGSVGRNGSRGVVASSGFGNGTATGDNKAPAPSVAVQASGFGNANVPAPSAVHPHAEVAAGPVLPAEILSKPTPIYTAEARSLGIEGEVLLEVVLQASGSLQVVRVVRGLGHGLDDNAVKAAEQIRFRPAMRNGQPADSKVVLHIVFQLA